MPTISIPIREIDVEARAQLEYSLSFASEDVLSCRVNVDDSTIEAEVANEANCEEVRRKIEELVERYSKSEFGLPKSVDFQNARELPVIDAWAQLLDRRWITCVGEGHVILR